MAGLVIISLTNLIILFIQNSAHPSIWVRAYFFPLWLSMLLYFIVVNGSIGKLFKQFLLFLVAFAMVVISISEGGLFSNRIFWLSLLPIVGGLILLKRGVLIGFLAGICGITIVAYISIFTNFFDIHSLIIGNIISNRIITLIQIVFFMTFFSYLAQSVLLKMINIIKAENDLLVNLLGHTGKEINFNVNRIIEVCKNLQKNSDLKLEELKKISNILKATDSIVEITDHVDLINNIEMNELMVKLAPVMPKVIMERAQFIFYRKLRDKNIELIFENNLSFGIAILADITVLSNQVINNFILNAIKFSVEGSKIFVIFIEMDEKVKIVIKDRGIGIPKDILINLFNLTYQTSRRGTAGENGTGFGMPIAKSAVENMGGVLKIETKDIAHFPNESGTTVTVILDKVKG